MKVHHRLPSSLGAVLALLVLATLVGAELAGVGQAARQPTQDEARQIEERISAWIACCVDAESATVRATRISTAVPRFARADVRILYPAAKPMSAIAVLRKGPYGWKVLDAGIGALGCSAVPPKARIDLGLGSRGRCLRTGS